jgi:hypothetical protein
MKTKIIFCFTLVLSTHLAFAFSLDIHVPPNLPPDSNLPVSVQVTDMDFGKHFTVLLNNIGIDSDQFVVAQLEVCSEDNQIASCPVEKKWTTNGVQFQFTVSATCVQASRFRVAIQSHRGKQPDPAYTGYWFYLRDFATNDAQIPKQTSNWEVAPEILKALPKRIRALRPGKTKDEVCKQLNLFGHSLIADSDDLSPDRYRLSWNYAIEFTFPETTNDFTIGKADDGQTFFKDNRKLIRVVLYKNGLEVCRSGK